LGSWRRYLRLLGHRRLLRWSLGHGLFGLACCLRGTVSLGLRWSLLRADPNVSACAHIYELEVVLRDVLGANNVRRDGEDDFVLLALLVLLRKEIL
jgi:hypothetical protein